MQRRGVPPPLLKTSACKFLPAKSSGKSSGKTIVTSFKDTRSAGVWKMHIINIIIQAPLGTPCKPGSDKNNNDWQNMHNFLYYENYNCTIIWLLKASAVESCEMNLLVFLKFHLFCKGFSAQAAGIMFLVFENHLVFPEIASLCECPCTKCAAEGPHTHVNKLMFS